MIPMIGLVLHYKAPKIKHQNQDFRNINIANNAKDYLCHRPVRYMEIEWLHISRPWEFRNLTLPMN